MGHKLLLVAPTCDGTDVGEAWVAFQWATRLAEQHDVTLLTYHKRGKTPASEQLGNCRVIEWQEPPLVGRAERFNSLLKPGYLPFLVRARRWARDAIARGERFDVAHQVTPVAMRYPTPLAGLGIPYVIGPVGGGLPTPPGFADGDTAPWYVSLRSVDSFRMRRDPVLRRSYQEASCVLAIAPYVSDLLAGVGVRRIEVLSETAIGALGPELQRRISAGPLRLLFVGRVIRTKGARDAIRAMSLLPDDVEAVLDVVGDGPDLEQCQQLAQTLGVADRVVFHGRQARADVDRFYEAADVFVFPSFREPGGNVAFEAMSFSLPLIVCTTGGPGAAVDDRCGFRIAPDGPERYAADIADAIARLARDPDRRLAMGREARRRVEQVGLWESKISYVGELYDQLVGTAARR